MKKTFVAIAALALALTGCGGKDDAATAEKAAPSMLEKAKEMSGKAEDAMAKSAEDMTEKAKEAAKTSMAAASDSAKNAMESAKSAAQDAVHGAATAVQEKAEQLAMAVPASTSGSAGFTIDADTLAMGKKVYDSNCFACHGTGVAGAPKLGDKPVWQTRTEQGMDIMVEHAIKGYRGSAGYMPPKGGFASLSDKDVTAAVAYMVEQGK